MSDRRAETDEGVTERRQLPDQAPMPPALSLLADRPFRFGFFPGPPVRLPTVENDRHLGLAGKFSRQVGEEGRLVARHDEEVSHTSILAEHAGAGQRPRSRRSTRWAARASLD